MESFVTFKNKNDQITGILYQPDKQSIDDTAIILMHGWAGYRIGPHRILVQAARRFCSEGFNVLRFDFRGRGDSDGNSFEVGSTESEAKPFLVSDTVCAIKYLTDHLKIKKVILGGICNGGEVAFFTAQKKIKEIDSIILWSTTTFLLNGANEFGFRRLSYYLKIYLTKLLYLNTWYKIFSFNINIKNILNTLFISKKKLRKHKDRNPYIDVTKKNEIGTTEKLKSQQININKALMVYGEADPSTEKSSSFYIDSFKKSNVAYNLLIVPGADHNFSSLVLKKQVIDYTSEWLISNYRT